MATPDLFIIESLRFEDEELDYPEGKFLAHILRLAGRNVHYYYIRTRAELDAVIDRFEDSDFRYLHLSCHADAKGIELTLDTLTVGELGEMLAPVLRNRRVFLSACELATPELATALMKGSGCFSVIGPSTTIDVDESAVFWASVYFLMYRSDAKVMKRADLRRNVKKAAKLFGVSMRYFARDADAENEWEEVDVAG
jgi:hypothetical protein